MTDNLQIMTVSLRVLTAINTSRPPDPGDVDLLRGYVGLAAPDSLDELACAVIQKALERRAKMRSALKGY
jgi:hypothetical protein